MGYPEVMSDSSWADLSVTELRDARAAGTGLRVLDVREPFELEIAAIPVDATIPLGELPARVGELDPTAEWAVLCRSGGRSGQAAAFLREQGFTRVHNVAGGILAWAKEIDPSMTSY